MKPGYQGVRRLVWATRWAFAGLIAGARREAAIRQELVLIVAGAVAAQWVTEDLFQRAILVAVLMLVLVVELLNSAIEAVVDRISSERHELSGLAKDLGAAAVFVSLSIAGVVWFSVLWPLIRSRWA